jgi:hypothetical protein
LVRGVAGLRFGAGRRQEMTINVVSSQGGDAPLRNHCVSRLARVVLLGPGRSTRCAPQHGEIEMNRRSHTKRSQAHGAAKLSGAILLLALLCGACCGQETEQGVSVAPERFVMATVSNNQGALNTVEVRVSPDGETWSAPSYPLTLDCNLPIPVDSRISPALGVTPSHYLVAAYDRGGTLYFSKSRDGVTWTPAEVATTVRAEGLGSDSRPSVVYDRDERAWVAILSTFNGGNPYQPSFGYLDGAVAGLRETILDWAPSRGTAIAYTGIPGARYIVAHTQRGKVNNAIYDGLASSSVIQFAASTDGTRVTTGGSPWITSTLSQVWLATSRDVQVPTPDPDDGEDLFTQGWNEIWEYDFESDTWDRAFYIDGASPGHEGPSVAGVRTNMVVTSPGRNQTTDVWHVAPDRLDVLRAEYQKLQTRSNKPAAIVFGPKLAGGQLRDLCGGPGEPLLRVFLRFRSFKNLIPPDLGDFDDSEDVTLEIAHKTRLGFIDRKYDADPTTDGIQVQVVRDATKNQSHNFNEGEPGSSWPELRFVMQPDEVVTVTLTGDGGETSVDITYAELAAPQGAGNTKNTRTLYEDGSFGYQLIYDATVAAE